MRPIERPEYDVPSYIVQLHQLGQDLVSEAWARDCGYAEYVEWCTRQDKSPIDENLFNVFYEALQEQYIYKTSRR